MSQKVTTLTEFILAEERNFPQATGSFTLLMTHIENAAKIIASHVKKNGLVDLMGATGEKNVFAEEVQKMDKFANDLLVDILTKTGHVSAIVTEELDKPELIRTDYGEYVIYMDPLDGSSNIDVNLNIGTIFSIHRKPETIKGDSSLLLKGNSQIAAGYIVYGPSVMFVYTCGNGVNAFTLDPSIGSFILSHPDIRVPKQAKTYAINEGYYNLYPDYIKKYLNHIKQEDRQTGRPYSTRYASAMIADIHRILLKGGVFLYPENSKKPYGKLRLMYEVNPMAFIITQAGGAATSRGTDPLEITPAKLDQCTPIVLGSVNLVNEFLSFLNNK